MLNSVWVRVPPALPLLLGNLLMPWSVIKKKYIKVKYSFEYIDETILYTGGEFKCRAIFNRCKKSLPSNVAIFLIWDSVDGSECVESLHG